MNIHVYTTTWNEEYILPYFLKYYSSFCSKIIVYDNNSTDSTAEIVKSYPNTEIFSYDTGNHFDESVLTSIRNTAYKNSRGKADWVFVVDADEFIYHPDIINLLEEYKKEGINYPNVEGYEMIPNTTLNLHDRLPYDYPFGIPNSWLCKKVVLDPTLDAKFSFGSHFNQLPDNGKLSPNADLKLLHYKMLNLDYLIERYRSLDNRRPQIAKDNNWSYHCGQSREEITDRYNLTLTKSFKII